MTDAREIILTIRNRHVDSAPNLDEVIGDRSAYRSYFENALGEQWVFIRPRGEDGRPLERGFLYGGDNGWQAVEVYERTPEQVRDQLLSDGMPARYADDYVSKADPLVGTLLLAAAELAWVYTCWTASDAYEGEGQAAREVLGRWIARRTGGSWLLRHPNTQEFRGRMTGVAGVVGYEVGRRGWDVDSTATVLRGITEEFKLIERELKDAGAPPTTRQRVAEREDENAASAPAGVTAEGAGMRWLDLDIPPSSYTDTIAAALTPEFPYLYARVPVEDKRTVTGLRQAGKAAGTKIGRRVKVEAHLMKGADPWRWVSISIDDLSAEERMAVSGRAMQILGDAIFPDQP